MALEDVVKGAGGYSPPWGTSAAIMQVLREDPSAPVGASEGQALGAQNLASPSLAGTSRFSQSPPRFAAQYSVVRPLLSRAQTLEGAMVGDGVLEAGRNVGLGIASALKPGSATVASRHEKATPGGSGTQTTSATSKDQVRPSYLQAINGINPLYEDMVWGPGGSHAASHARYVSGSSRSDMQTMHDSVKNLSSSFLGGVEGKGKEPMPQPEPLAASGPSLRNPSPGPQDQSSRAQGRIVCHSVDLNLWQAKLESKAVVGSCFGPRPPVEHLKNWMLLNWSNRGISLPHVQYLPNGYFVFMFEEAAHAQFVLNQGTWLFKNSPLLLQPWTADFNPKGPRSTVYPVWVDFPELPLQFYPWLKELGNQLGKVKGHKPVPPINPKWEPQLLIEIDTALDLKEEILIFDEEGQILHVQKVIYKNLPNACFHCLKQGHLIKDCPGLVKKQVDEQGFQNTDKRNANKNKNIPKNGKKNGAPNLNRFSPLLVEVHDPFVSKDSIPEDKEGEEEDLQGPVMGGSSPPAPNEGIKSPSLPSSPSTGSIASGDGEFVIDTQLRSFAEKLEQRDQERKMEISSLKSVEIEMTQAEEEALPPIKTKRKKEKNTDSLRTSVQYAKPPKNSKKFP